jgi:uncharacterized protein YbjQ (UPF0145 family)
MTDAVTNPLGDPSEREADLGDLGRLLAAGQGSRDIGQGCTSDLSLDEVLLLHSVGLEPASVVTSASCVTLPSTIWSWSTGQVEAADYSFGRAFQTAREHLSEQVHQAGAIGAVGIEVEIELAPHRFLITMIGTSVRPVTDQDGGARFPVRYRTPFLCDLSARDFVVLSRSGWYPINLVGGASFVHAPRRTMGAALGQATQNVELTNMTETLYEARERAMGQLQQDIQLSGGTGLVDVHVVDQPLHFAHHVIRFTAVGTAIKLLADQHSHPDLQMVVSLDDQVFGFEASSLD